MRKTVNRLSASNTSRFRRAAAVAAAFGSLSACATGGGGDSAAALEYSDRSSWQTFSNSELGFEIRFPPGWQIAVFAGDRVRPVFAIYPGDRHGGPAPPFTFRDEIANVTICPRGCRTGGFFGLVSASSVALGPGVGEARDYALQDESLYGTVARFSNTPPGWNDKALMWARAEIRKLRRHCRRNGRRVKYKHCKPGTGDIVVYKGKVDQRMIPVLNRILRSFRFTGTLRG